MRKKWESLYYYIRYWLIVYKKNARYSNYKSKIKQTPIYVQVITSIKQTSVKYKVIIVTISIVHAIFVRLRWALEYVYLYA